MAKPNGRSIDHLVLPVSSLEASSARYRALGFQVSPMGQHPFGTQNACLWFQNDTYLEPLAIADKVAYEASCAKNIPFITRDKTYRETLGDDGFSCVAFSTDDAERDYKVFQDKGYETGNLFAFSRPGKTATGEDCTYSFKGAFACFDKSPVFCAFALERHNVPSLKHAPISVHENGALGVVRVVLVADKPKDFASYLEDITNQVGSQSFGCTQSVGGTQSLGDYFTYNLPNARLDVMTPNQFMDAFGVEAEIGANGLQACAVEIKVKDLDAVAKLAKQNTIDYKLVESKINPRLIVPPAIGQGYVLSFIAE